MNSARFIDNFVYVKIINVRLAALQNNNSAAFVNSTIEYCIRVLTRIYVVYAHWGFDTTVYNGADLTLTMKIVLYTESYRRLYTVVVVFVFGRILLSRMLDGLSLESIIMREAM